MSRLLLCTPRTAEDAQYLGYPDGRGGTIIVRQGASVW